MKKGGGAGGRDEQFTLVRRYYNDILSPSYIGKLVRNHHLKGRSLQGCWRRMDRCMSSFRMKK